MVRQTIFIFAWCLAIQVLQVCPVSAQIDPTALEKRIESLEKELQDLKLLLQEQSTEKVKKGELGTRDEKVAEVAAPKTAASVADGFQFKPYGYIKLDAIYDDSESNYGNFALYVPNESGDHNDAKFNMTARQTRVGLNIIAPQFEGWSTQGKLEIDFYGDGTKHENKAEPLLRHAVLEMKKGNLGLLAGQAADLISPLTPNTLNYTVAWAAGNIGYRRPQLRATYNLRLNDTNQLINAMAVARTAGLINEDLDLDGYNDGDDAGFPTIQARIALATREFSSGESIFGISGHYGEEEIDFRLLTAGTNSKKIRSWSINGDFSIPVSDQWSFAAEVFCGSNLDDYFGGILQGVNTDDRRGIQAIGGWAQVNYKWAQKWQSNLGFGIDDPKNSDLSDGMRSRNMTVYINAFYKLIDPVTLGIEYSNWQTRYVNGSTGIDNRIQTSFIFNW